MLLTILKEIRLKCLNAYRSFYKTYTRDKYNITGDICFVYSDDGKRLFFMTDTTQGVCMPSDKAGIYIRKLCGANKLNEYGPPMPEQIVPQLVLVPTLSMLKVLGVKNFIKFIKDWEGDSKIGKGPKEIVVLKYSVMR
jgi:hypothetical protein